MLNCLFTYDVDLVTNLKFIKCFKLSFLYNLGYMIINLTLFADTHVLQNCTVTSPSIGTIRVSCDSPHQIIATVKCTNCNNSMVTTISGSSPLTVGGLVPGMVYSVMINVFDGNQVVLRGRVVIKTITVMSTISCEIYYYIYLHVCVQHKLYI